MIAEQTTIEPGFIGTVEIAPGVIGAERRSRLYSGAVIVETGVEACRQLGEFAWEMLVDALAPHDPLTVHQHVDADALSDRLIDVKPRFIHHPRSKELMSTLLDELGFDLADTYFDLPKLRTAYPTNHLTTGIAKAFQRHRDTWYAAPPQQINLWMPIRPASTNDAMLFYPQGFDRHVPNNSARYNYYAANLQRRDIKAMSGAVDSRVHPEPDADFDPGPSLTVIPPVGGVMMFSGDQLHASIPNSTQRARYSIDVRIVHRPDVEARVGAPCRDVACEGTALRDFLRGSDHSRLDEELVETYDVDPSQRLGALIFEPKW